MPKRGNQDMGDDNTPTLYQLYMKRDFPGGTSDKEPICQCRRRKRHGFNPWSGRSPGGGQHTPVLLFLIYLLLQYSCLENPMDRGSWWATVQRVAKTQTQLKQLSMHAYMRRSKPHKNMNGKQYRSHPRYNPQSLFSNLFFLRV